MLFVDPQCLSRDTNDGAYLWPLLDGTRDREELCRLVRERFAVPSDADVARDVDAFLSGLSERGLLSP